MAYSANRRFVARAVSGLGAMILAVGMGTVALADTANGSETTSSSGSHDEISPAADPSQSSDQVVDSDDVHFDDQVHDDVTSSEGFEEGYGDGRSEDDAPDVAGGAAIAPGSRLLGDTRIQPLADRGEAEITINAAAIRSSSTGLEGLTYTLHELQGSGSNNNPYRPGVASEFSCTIQSGDSSCTITVTGVDRQGGNDKRWFLVQTANPATGYDVAQYRLNNFSNPQDVFHYVGRTVSLQSGQDYDVPGGNQTTAGLQERSGIYTRANTLALPLNNPQIQPTCTPGLKVAIQMDVSSSTDGYRTDYRNALHGLIDGLAGTGTQISLFTFGYASPANNREHAAPRSVDAQADAIKRDITTYTNNTSSNATNWDAAYRRVADANVTHGYDLVLFITDGAPNVVWADNRNGYEQPNGLNVTVRSIDEAVLSANELKNAGVRVATVGVGAGVEGDVYRNLQAISGPTRNGDFYVGGWDELQTYLKNIVDAANCRLPVTVSKTTISNNGVTADNVAGWNFSAVKTADSHSDVVLNGNSTQTSRSGFNGRPQWNLNFSQPDGQTAGVTLTETSVRSGYEFVGATCTVNGVEVDAEVDPEARSVTVPGLDARSGQVHCVFTNAQLGVASWAKADESGEMLAGSVWSLRGPIGDTSVDREVIDCTSEPCTGLDQDARPGQFEVRDLPYGEYTLIETAAPPGYQLDETEHTKVMVNGRVDFQVIQNVRLPHGELAIVKTFDETVPADYGDTEFTGTYVCVLEGDEVASGTWSVTGAGPAALTPDFGAPAADAIPASAECSATETTPSGSDGLPDGSWVWSETPEISDPVKIELDELVKITVTNSTTRVLGSVTWTKVDENGDPLANSEWSLQGPDLFNDGDPLMIEDCVADSTEDCAGPDMDPKSGQFQIVDLPWGEYEMTETRAPAGYYPIQDPIQFEITGDDEMSLHVVLDPVVNRPIDGPALPFTGGLGRDFFAIAGLVVTGLGLGAAGALRARARRGQAA